MKKHTITFLSLCILLCVTSVARMAGGADVPRLPRPEVEALCEGILLPPALDFRANLILPDDGNIPQQNVWMAFRKTFELSSIPDRAVCRVACDSKYWLWVNGQNVVFEGELKRGPTPKDTYFDLVDLRPFLKEGKNVVAIQTWYFGKHGFSHNSSGQPGLIFDATTNGESGLTLLSDGTWKAKVLTPTVAGGANQPYDLTVSDPQPNFRLAESHVRFDARRDGEPGWKSESFDDSGWKSARVVSGANDTAWGRLFVRPVPLWKDYGLKSFVSREVVSLENGMKQVVCRMPYNAQFTPWLRVRARGGEPIVVTMDNYDMGPDTFTCRAEYVCRAGEQEHESLGWMNGNVATFTLPESVEVLDLKFRETGYATEFAGEFSCDDVFYNRLYDKAVRTLYVTMRDTYFDCPDRERSQWWGDACNELGEAFFALGREADALPHKGLYELMRWQRKNGTIFAPIPAGNWNKELPAQMLTTIGTYGLGTYEFYSGDLATGVDLYPRILRYLAEWEFDDEGLVKVRNGDWSWADWGTDIDLRVTLNCWYATALDEAIRLGERIQNPGENPSPDVLRVIRENPSVKSLDIDGTLEILRAQRKSLQDNFDRVFWNGKAYRDPDYKGATDDRANAMAVLTGLANSERYPAIREVLRVEKHASPYMEKYVLESLFFMGYETDGLARMKERFTEMVESTEYTTLWEFWQTAGGSINHAWTGGGLTCLVQYVAGISPTAPAFREFEVRPRLGGLKTVHAVVPTYFGKIVLDIADGNLRLVVPKGTKANVIWNEGTVQIVEE